MLADVEYDEARQVQGGLWQITPHNERALDRYEGVESGLYDKEYLQVRVVIKGVVHEGRCLIYRMRRDSEYYMPGNYYLQAIRDGYDDFGLDQRALAGALRWTAARCDGEQVAARIGVPAAVSPGSHRAREGARGTHSNGGMIP